MTVKARMYVEEPDKIEMSLKLTMNIKEWTDLRDQLKSDYPSWKLRGSIEQLITTVREVFYADEKEVTP